jgi:hypothetical protein
VNEIGVRWSMRNRSHADERPVAVPITVTGNSHDLVSRPRHGSVRSKELARRFDWTGPDCSRIKPRLPLMTAANRRSTFALIPLAFLNLNNVASHDDMHRDRRYADRVLASRIFNSNGYERV